MAKDVAWRLVQSIRTAWTSPHPFRVRLAGTLRIFISVVLLGAGSAGLNAQSASISSPAEQQQIADRFLSVLLRRPSPGTALDRVYEFHVQNGSIDSFLASLDVTMDVPEAGQKQFVLGLIQSRRNRFTDAVVALQKAESWLPQDANASYELAKALVADGERAAAIAALNRAIERDPDRQTRTEVYAYLGRLYLHSGEHQQAVKTWKQLVERNLSDPATNEKVAQWLAEAQQYAEALKLVENLQTQAKSEAAKIRYQVQAAELNLSLGHTKQAREELRRLLGRLRPGSWLYRDVRHRFERSFITAGDYDALATYYTEQTKQSPDNLSSLVRLGQILASMGESDRAEQTYRKALELSPTQTDARLSLIDLLLASDRPGLAARQVEELLLHDPGNPDYLMRLGDVRLRDHSVSLDLRRANAAAAWKQLADTRADDAVVLTAVAGKMESIQRDDAAVDLYRQAVDCDPQSSQYRENLGRCLFRLQRRDEAIEAWESIASGQRLNRDSLLRLARVFESHQLADWELKTWKRAAQMDLSLDQRLQFVRVLIKAGEFDRATNEIEQAESLVQDEQGREKLLTQRIEVTVAAGRLDHAIGQLSLEEPSAENQRLLARLLHADRQYSAASLAIGNAREFAPDDNRILIDAAKIAESAGHLALAVDQLTELIQRDQRGAPTHLRKLIQLQERLRLPAAALESARQLVDVSPTASDAYEIFARLAFALGQAEQGEKMLRRAIIALPRSIGVRLTLAERLAERFDTAEAIELIWQAIESDSQSTAQSGLIRKLVPLYARRGEIDQLVSRISRMDASRVDEKSKLILAAAVWSSVKDFRQAQLTLTQALNQHPQDVLLLSELVETCLESDQPKLAVEYQRRIAEVSGSPNAKRRLRELELAAGVITEYEASVQEIQETDDPKRLASIAIRNAGRDPEQSAALCKIVLEKVPDLWGLKIVRSQLLLLSDSPNRDNDLAEAFRIASEVESLQFKDDLPTESLGVSPSPPVLVTRGIVPIGAPALRQRPLVGTQRTVRSSLHFVSGTATVSPGVSSFPLDAARSIATIQQLNRRRIESRRNTGQKSYSFQYGANFISPATYYQARWIALCVKVIAAADLSKQNDGRVVSVGGIDRLYPSPDPSSDDVKRLREALMIGKVIEVLTSTEVPGRSEIVWRIAELSPHDEHPDLTLILDERKNQQQLDGAVVGPEVKPLSQRQIQILAKVCLTHQELALSKTRSINDIMRDLKLRRLLTTECRFAGVKSPLVNSPTLQSRRVAFSEVLAEIQSALWEGDVDAAGEYVSSLASIARNSQSSTLLDDASLTWLSSPSNQTEIQFVLRHREALLDAWIAHCSQSMVANQLTFPPSEVVWGAPIQIVVPIMNLELEKPRYKIFRIQTPLSKRLLDERLIRGLVPLVPTQSTSSDSRLAFRIENNLSQRLSRPLKGATPHEQKLRFLLSAFSAWWDGRPEDCYLQLQTLAESYPDDLDLQLESARFALICGEESAAFDRIDQLNPLDEAAQIQVDITRVILAAKAGKEEMVRLTAQKLLSKSIGPDLRSFLARQLRGGAAQNPTVASVRQAISAPPKLRPVSASSIANDDKKKIELATRLLQSGDAMTACEIAYSVINRHQSSERLRRTRVRQQAIEILASTGRLQPLIESTERKSASSPDSEAYRQELADLYMAAGQGEKASLLWQEVIQKRKLSPREIIRRASTLRSQREYHQAAILYLYAFQADPSLWDSHWHVFIDSASLSTSQNLLFDFLCKMQIESFRCDTLANVIRLRGETVFSDSQRKFARYVLSTHPDRQAHLATFLSVIPESERGHIPQLRSLMVDVITDESIFDPAFQYWKLTHWTQEGFVSGILGDVMDSLWTDHELGQKFEAFAKKHDASPVAKILLATYQLNDSSTVDQTLDQIKLSCPVTMPHQQLTTRQTELPGGLLWQIGQLFDSIDSVEDPAHLKVGVFQAALAAMDTLESSTSEQAHPQDQLYRAYVEIGRPELARRAVLKRFEGAKYPKTTGIREDRKLRLATHVSGQLIDFGFPVDAGRICQQMLNQPVLFSLARRYARGTNHKLNLETNQRKALNAINEFNSEVYFNELRYDLVDLNQLEIDLGIIQSAEAMASPLRCLFCLAADKAAETDSGHQSMQRLYQVLHDGEFEQGERTSLYMAQLVLAAKIESDDLGELLSLFPKNVNPDEFSLPEVLSVLTAVRNAVSEESSRSFEDAIVLTRTRYSDGSNGDTLLKLARLSSMPNSISMVLESISQRSGDSPPQPQDLIDCLQLAEQLAKSGEWNLVVRALEIAMAKGPPRIETGASTPVVDPYGGSVPTKQPQTQADLMQSVQAGLVQVLSTIQDSEGRPATALGFDSATCKLSDDVLQKFDKIMRRIIFPNDKFVNVYAYQSPMPFADGTLETGAKLGSESVVFAACNFAVSAGTDTTLMAKIKECINLSQTPEIASAYVSIAVACGSSDETDDAIAILREAVNDRLPMAVSNEFPATDDRSQPTVSRPKPPSGQTAILTLAEQIMPVVWPVRTSDEISAESRATVCELVDRTLTLLKSDSELAAMHADWIKDIEMQNRRIAK